MEELRRNIYMADPLEVSDFLGRPAAQRKSTQGLPNHPSNLPTLRSQDSPAPSGWLDWRLQRFVLQWCRWFMVTVPQKAEKLISS